MDEDEWEDVEEDSSAIIVLDKQPRRRSSLICPIYNVRFYKIVVLKIENDFRTPSLSMLDDR